MKTRPSVRHLLIADLTRCRMRPVLGRIPLWGGAALGLLTGLVLVGGIPVVGPHQMADVIGIFAMIGVVGAFMAGASVQQGLRDSGTANTDRFLLGRPATTTASHLAASAAWAGVCSIGIAAGIGVGFVVGAVDQGRLDAIGPWFHVWLPAVARSTAALALAAAFGGALSSLVRSATVAIGTFIAMVLIGDGLIIREQTAARWAALPDNLLAIGSGQLEGLAVHGAPYSAAVIGGAAGTTLIAALAIWRSTITDLP